MAKNMATFCPCPKTLLAANLRNFALMALVEEVSEQPSTDYAAQLSVDSLMHIHNEKQENIQNVQYKE